ncbi:MAG: patatin-like phospholipase family protein [Burkholderiaceae bacterium]
MTEPLGLVLSGGGARAAYQVGVLEGICELLSRAGWPRSVNPFPIIAGTSAGAINAASLAAGAADFQTAVARLVALWSDIRPDQIYRTDVAGAFANAAHWVGALTAGWAVRRAPRSLFDNRPLAGLLESVVDFGAIRKALSAGMLQAFAVTASSYSSGQHVTFYASRAPCDPWYRTQRLACPAQIGLDHLMASSAIPFVFPAVPLTLGGHHEYFGDGAMRQTAPISPAIHLGASRIVMIGAGRIERGLAQAEHLDPRLEYPSLGQIATHAMACIFLDNVASDIERLDRVNGTLALMDPAARTLSPLRTIDSAMLMPSQRLDQLANDHVGRLPATTRSMLRLLGAAGPRGAGLASYLLFDARYTRTLMDLGRTDAQANTEAIKRVLTL